MHFETVDSVELLRYCGANYPQIRHFVSIIEHDRIEQLVGPVPDFSTRDVVFSFEGLIRKTPFVARIRELLTLLEAKLGTPVDIEFAYDGEDFYLLQCRPQSYSGDAVPVSIPQNLPADKMIFSANRFVSNGKVPEITHIVYVDLEGYSQLSDQADMRDVGRAVGRLNKLLPKRQFILIGPGRWGSRGDIKLGVPVTYSDINNTAMLIEVARQRGNYLPDLSFGTHFFQDLVEASIRYLPLYPDDPQTAFKEEFLRGSPQRAGGTASRICAPVRHAPRHRCPEGERRPDLASADERRTGPGGGLSFPSTYNGTDRLESDVEIVDRTGEEHWRWRFRMAQRIAAQARSAIVRGQGVLPDRQHEERNRWSGRATSICCLHFQGTEEQKRELLLWLEGWSRCLSEINFLRTGYRTEGLLDVHLITDTDIAERSSYAVKIDAITDPARKLPMKEA